jgi:tRNA threonylcarbamoyladenosine biosynthesis protein TsaE
MKKRRLVSEEVKRVEGLAELREVAKDLCRSFARRQVVLLSGPLGAGKTQLVTFLTEALGAAGSSSPTFSIHQSYEFEGSSLEHVDIYRLESNTDLDSTGFWDLFSKERAVIVVEWADRLAGDWVNPSWSVKSIKIDVEKDQSRSLTIKGFDF